MKPIEGFAEVGSKSDSVLSLSGLNSPVPNTSNYQRRKRWWADKIMTTITSDHSEAQICHLCDIVECHLPLFSKEKSK